MGRDEDVVGFVGSRGGFLILVMRVLEKWCWMVGVEGLVLWSEVGRSWVRCSVCVVVCRLVVW